MITPDNNIELLSGWWIGMRTLKKCRHVRPCSKSLRRPSLQPYLVSPEVKTYFYVWLPKTFKKNWPLNAALWWFDKCITTWQYYFQIHSLNKCWKRNKKLVGKLRSRFCLRWRQHPESRTHPNPASEPWPMPKFSLIRLTIPKPFDGLCNNTSLRIQTHLLQLLLSSLPFVVFQFGFRLYRKPIFHEV